MRIPKLLLAVIIITLAYFVLKIPSGHNMIPSSVIRIYMFFITVGVLLVMTFSEESAQALAAPIVSLLGDPGKKTLRSVVFIIVPLFFGYLTYNNVKPSFEAPVELRTVHPAPPSSVKMFGKSFNLLTLESPVRKDTANFAANVKEGGELYFKNCFYCHGDKLDGRGHYAHGFNPLPANFQDVGTIAQLQESYVFWRAATGGPGLPNEATPWLSAMPIWQNFVTEDELWKILLFLYDYTGKAPRVMKEEGEKEAMAPAMKPGDVGFMAVAYAEEQGAAAGPKQVYEKRCAWCHGWEGAGDGPAAEFLNPRPRDFTSGVYKYKTSPFDQPVPSDDDVLRTIKEGLPGTSMPGWTDLLSESDMKGLVTYIKTFSGIEKEKVATQVDTGKQVSSSDDSIKKGKDLFIDRCSECHGDEGRGDAIKALKTDWGDRIWPRDLTKSWTLRRGGDPKEIYTRISIGIPGTPMPSFADPENKKKLSEEERWHVVNYVKSFQQEPKAGEAVVKGIKIEGEVPTDPADPKWDAAEATTFPLVPNIIAKDRFFTPTIDDITLKAFYNEKEMAFLLEWDDRTKSIPGDSKAAELAEGELNEDAVAIQLPVTVPAGLEKPYFGHGDGKHPVNIWRWGSGTTDQPEKITLLDAKGIGQVAPREGESNLTGKGVYDKGRWRVVIKRSLQTGDKEKDLQLETGRFVPISFATWDGSNGEKGSKHELTTWYWVFLKPPTGSNVFVLPVIVMLVVFGGELLLAKQVRKK